MTKAHLETTSLAPGWPVYKPHSAGPAHRAGDWHKKAAKNGNPKTLWKECVWLVSATCLGDWRGDVLSSLLSWVGTGPGLTEGTEGKTLLENGPEKCLCAQRTGKRIPPL